MLWRVSISGGVFRVLEHTILTPVLQLTPIAAHSLASRALVLSDQEPVTVFPATPERL